MAAHLLVNDACVLQAHYVADHALAPAPAGVGRLHDVLAQFHMARTG